MEPVLPWAVSSCIPGHLGCRWRVFLGADHRTWSSQCWWHSTMKPKLPFSARHPAAPCWLESPDVTLCAADSTSVLVRDCHIFRCLLEMSVWYICVCQLFQCANFSGSFYHSLYQNSSAFCLVWMSWGTIREAAGEKGFWTCVVKILLSERRVFHYLCN